MCEWSGMREQVACGDLRGPGACPVLGGCLVGVGVWQRLTFVLDVKPLLSLSGSLVSQDGLVFMYCWFSPSWSLCNFSLIIAVYNPLNLEPSVKLISVLFTLFSQIINEDKTFNGPEFCSHFWEIPLRLSLVSGNHL